MRQIKWKITFYLVSYAGKLKFEKLILKKRNILTKETSFFYDKIKLLCIWCTFKIDINEQQLATVGRNYINNILEPTTEGGARWYQFKIPIRQYEKAVGNISDFKSIRFMRMFMTNFDKEVMI